jgi:hypothetical protein
MNIGSIVKLRMDSWDPHPAELYGGETRCWDDRGYLITTKTLFDGKDVGLVLLTAEFPENKDFFYIKLLTPGGVGWAHRKILELVG